MIESVNPAHRSIWSGMAVDRADAQVGLMGVPFDSATSWRKGAAQAPARIRDITPYIPPITEEGLRLDALFIRDYGDVPPDLDWERYFAAVEAQAAKALQHPFTIFLGGDHSVTIPLVKAFSANIDTRFAYLQIDSHTDLMDSFIGHRWSHACTARRVLEYPNIDSRHMAFAGIRSWESEELDFLAEHPEIGVHKARQIHRRGMEASALDVIEQLRDADSVYVSLDIDSLDPAYAPGTGTPEAGGLSTRQLLEFLRLIFANLPVRALDIVEVSPPLDHSDITSLAAIKVIYESLGWQHAKLGSIGVDLEHI